MEEKFNILKKYALVFLKFLSHPLCHSAGTSVKEMFCHLVDSIENYIFKDIGKSYILFGIIGSLLRERDYRGDQTGPLTGEKKVSPRKFE